MIPIDIGRACPLVSLPSFHFGRQVGAGPFAPRRSGIILTLGLNVAFPLQSLTRPCGKKIGCSDRRSCEQQRSTDPRLCGVESAPEDLYVTFDHSPGAVWARVSGMLQ